MSKDQQARPGARRYLRDHAPSFLQYLEDGNFVSRHLELLTEGLTELLKSDVRDCEESVLFWKGIKPALAGCPRVEHFSTYENILAYGFVHFLDRYLRAWEVMRTLLEYCVLPAPRRDLSVLDTGSGPATALYAAGDFYEQLRGFATTQGIERLTIPRPDLQPIELSLGMCHFFHLLSEYSRRPGPFGPLLSDFGDFDPEELRESARRREEDEFYDEPGSSVYGRVGEIRTWAHDLYRYQLVFFSNFLTTPDLVTRFQQQLVFAFGNQRPGGVVVVLGGIGGRYQQIYQMVEAAARSGGHRRIPRIPEIFDDSFRKPFFSRIKAFNNAVWDHLEEVAGTTEFDKDGYPPYWDSEAPITSLKDYAVGVYRRTNKSVQQSMR